MCASVFDYLVKHDIGYQEVDLLGGLKAIVCRKVFLDRDAPTTEFIIIMEPASKRMQAVFTGMIGAPDGLICVNGAVEGDDEIRSFFREVIDSFPKVDAI